MLFVLLILVAAMAANIDVFKWRPKWFQVSWYPDGFMEPSRYHDT